MRDISDDDKSVTPANSSKPLNLSVTLFGIGLSVVDEMPEEILYFSLSSLSFAYVTSEAQESVELKIGRLQMDNQIYNTPFPIVVYSQIQSAEGGAESEPFLHFCAVREKGKCEKYI